MMRLIEPLIIIILTVVIRVAAVLVLIRWIGFIMLRVILTITVIITVAAVLASSGCSLLLLHNS